MNSQSNNQKSNNIHFTNPYIPNNSKNCPDDEYSLDQIISLVNVQHNLNHYHIQPHRDTTDKSIEQEQSVLSPTNLPPNYSPEIIPLLQKDKDLNNKYLPPLGHASAFIYHSANNYTHKSLMGTSKGITTGNNNNLNHQNPTNLNHQNPTNNLLIFKPWSGEIESSITWVHKEKENQFLEKKEGGGTHPIEPIEQIGQAIQEQIDDEEEEEKELVNLINNGENTSGKMKNNEHENEEGSDNDDCIKEEQLGSVKISHSLNKGDRESFQGYYYKFQNGKVKLIKYLLDENGFTDFALVPTFTKNDHQQSVDLAHKNKNWTIYWATTVIKPQTYSNLLPYQKVNHFPNSFHITRKDLMNKAISKMQYKYGFTNFNFLPKTYILPQQIDQLKKQFDTSPTTYIVKPHNRSQGKGITVTTSMDTILTKLQKYSSLIVSHYIDNPLLINRLKFDLRIYVAVTGINPLRIYVYEQGLARFATQQYQSFSEPLPSSGVNGKFQHLTNYSINKKNLDNFIKSSSNQDEYYGSKWSLSSMKDFLAYNIGKSETADLFNNIDDLIVKTLLSIENTLYTSFYTSSNSTSSRFNVPFINNCFQVYGFDVMIDQNLKPWLIQVNMSPSMNTDSPLDLKIKGNMIADLFTMLGVVSLKNRYIDGGWTRYECRHYFNKNDNMEVSSNKAGVLNPVDKFILKEVEAQNLRSGGFRRVFPNQRNNRYKMFFQKDRYFNKLVREKITYNSNKNISMQKSVGNTRNHNNILSNYRTTGSKVISTMKNVPQTVEKGKRNLSSNAGSLRHRNNVEWKQNVFNKGVQKKNNISNRNQYSTIEKAQKQREDGDDELIDEQLMKLLEMEGNMKGKEHNPLSSNKIITNINNFGYGGNSKKNISLRINRSKQSTKSAKSNAYNGIYGRIGQ